MRINLPGMKRFTFVPVLILTIIMVVVAIDEAYGMLEIKAFWLRTLRMLSETRLTVKQSQPSSSDGSLDTAR